MRTVRQISIEIHTRKGEMKAEQGARPLALGRHVFLDSYTTPITCSGGTYFWIHTLLPSPDFIFVTMFSFAQRSDVHRGPDRQTGMTDILDIRYHAGCTTICSLYTPSTSSAMRGKQSASFCAWPGLRCTAATSASKASWSSPCGCALAWAQIFRRK